MKLSKFEKKTRSIFHKIHKNQGKTEKIYKRLSTLLNTDYLKVNSDFFHDKICLDAGCGSNANATYNLLALGAKKVFAFDLDDSILKIADSKLKEFNKERYDVQIGNVLSINYPDDYFDFTHCSGVLHHTNDIFKALGELKRVTKPGGTIYLVTYGKGGVAREVVSLLREKYNNEIKFKRLIDELNEKDACDFIEWLLKSMTANGDKYFSKISRKTIEQMIDKDFILSVKDRLQAPVYHENSEEELVGWLKDNGFNNIERITRYPKFTNIRRFFSPLYFWYDHKVSRLLFGSGMIQLKAVKG